MANQQTRQTASGDNATAINIGHKTAAMRANSMESNKH